VPGSPSNAHGRVTRKSPPPSTPSPTSIRPAWRSTISFAIARPRPVPPNRRVVPSSPSEPLGLRAAKTPGWPVVLHRDDDVRLLDAQPDPHPSPSVRSFIAFGKGFARARASRSHEHQRLGTLDRHRDPRSFPRRRTARRLHYHEVDDVDPRRSSPSGRLGFPTSGIGHVPEQRLRRCLPVSSSRRASRATGPRQAGRSGLA
jgi:hypothetical protein